jgi:hypothetical protein
MGLSMGICARIGAVAAFLCIAAGSAPAHAESLPRLIPRLIEKGGWLKGHFPAAGPVAQADDGSRAPQLVPSKWFGDTLHFSFVARDWREAYSITDGHPLVFDRVRLVRTSRMAVSRLSLTQGRIVPFAEVSVGQWRLDPDLMPTMPRDTELAAQLAVGFEVRIAPACAVAWNLERTSIYRETHDAQTLPVTNVTASFAALRAEF